MIPYSSGLWNDGGSLGLFNTSGPHLSMFWGDKMARQPPNHSSLWWQGAGNDNCLNMPQLAPTQSILIHPHSLTHLLGSWSEIYMSVHRTRWSPSVQFEKLSSSCPPPFSGNCAGPFHPLQLTKTESIQKQQLLSPGWARIHLPRVYPSAAVECVTPCPGAITVPLHTRFPQFITTIGACQLLLMIAQPLPMKQTIDWQRRWGGWGLPRH